MRVIFTGGGTGGHVSPALAIAEIIKAHYPGCEVMFIGRKDGPENAPIKNAGYKLYTVDISGLRRSLSIKNLIALFKIPFSIKTAGRYIDEFKPDLIIGTGGYVSYPALHCGIKKGIPTVIHESNAYPGLVTKVLGKRCNTVLLGMEAAKDGLKRGTNAIFVGNPVRREFYKISKSLARESLGISENEIYVISFGGSGGAEKLNKVIANLMLDGYGKSIVHLHATGNKYYSSMIQEYPKLKRGKMRLVPFINDMHLHLAAADIAITRSGAMTVAELCASKTPSILIPSPNVAANHQFKNAESLSKLGAAVTVTEESVNKERLKIEIEKLIANKQLLRDMEKKLAALAAHRTDAAVIKAINETLKQHKNNSAIQ